ncbi:MAG: L-threonylcarbamoyladenylate synthase [Chloroflexota bacterium]|nr:L-threonylcarbamoyladenylate synthase [Chloroflexota bacterium]
MTAELLDASAAGIARAAEVLVGGGLVCFPTDTVYGLACRADSEPARDRFYAAKERPADQPSILMAASAEAMGEWVALDARALRLAGEHWPGALTLVLPATERALARFGTVVRDGTLAVRIPAHPVALALLRAAAVPLATSSANRAGGDPPASSAAALEGLGDGVDAVLVGAPGSGRASSILDLTRPEPRIVREGSIPAARRM